MKKFVLLSIASVLAFAACKKPGAPLEKPEIVLKSVSHETVIEYTPKDTVFINLRYSMAVKDVGSSLETIVYVKDTRDQTQTPFAFPDELAQKLPDAADEPNISGAITLKLAVESFFILRPDRQDGDTLQLEVYMETKGGKKSNTVTTPDIFILPK